MGSYLILLLFKLPFSSIKKKNNCVFQQRTEHKQETHNQVFVNGFNVIHLTQNKQNKIDIKIWWYFDRKNA